MEVMIATAVLGIAMAALVKLHTAAIRGTKTTRDLSIAQDIARQVADEISARDPSTLPSSLFPLITDPCSAPPPIGQDGGCKGNAGGFTRDFAPQKAGNCTAWFSETGPSRLRSGGLDGGNPPNDEAGALAIGARYRVDRIVRPHPDGGGRSTVVDVFVCWRDQGNIVRQTHTRRVVGT